MKLSITPAAQEQINKVYQPDDILVLDFEDGQGPFVDAGASCQLYPHFRLLFVPNHFSKEELSFYDDQLETELGTVYTKKSSEAFLDKEVRFSVEKSYQRLQLTSDSGVLAATVPLKRIELDEKGQYHGQASRTNGSTC